MTTNDTNLTIDELLKEYPEYTQLITDALCWLNDREHVWKLSKPINRTQFMNDLVERAMVANKDY